MEQIERIRTGLSFILRDYILLAGIIFPQMPQIEGTQIFEDFILFCRKTPSFLIG
jgi:hypothetical protein